MTTFNDILILADTCRTQRNAVRCADCPAHGQPGCPWELQITHPTPRQRLNADPTIEERVRRLFETADGKVIRRSS